ncbi:MAG: hypothetical protein K2O04_01520 [Clostridiales bacterium]|nr:hypothetical protein [Clostridiales bacterium]
MRSIKDFGREDSKNENDNRTLRDEVQAVANKYVGKSEEELLRALRQNVAEAKRNGTFSEEQLDGFVSLVSSGLDDIARQRLNALVEMIKAE